MPSDAATQADRIVAIDTHMANGAPVSVPFDGKLDGELSPDVLVEHRPIATVGTTATNTSPHVPPAGKSFDRPPSNRARVIAGSATVLANNRQVARDGDTAETCNDPDDEPAGSIIAACTVKVGG